MTIMHIRYKFHVNASAIVLNGYKFTGFISQLQNVLICTEKPKLTTLMCLYVDHLPNSNSCHGPHSI